MIFILLSWIYTFFISTGMGSFLFPLTRTKNPSFLIISGLFVQLLLLHFWALFLPVNQLFYLLNTVMATLALYSKRLEIKEIIANALIDFKNAGIFLKLVFGFIFITALMQSSVSPVLPDNESYYAQSIKWLNEYGLVKGLANLHFFFGQSSGWHLLQSSFNFGFWFDFLNDLNAFLLVTVAFFSCNRMDSFFKNKNSIDLFAGLIFIFSLFLFRFLDSPNPDLPVFLISPLMIWIFYKNFQNPEYKSVVLLFVFGFLLCLIKVTSFPVLLLLFILLFKSAEFAKLFKIVFVFGLLVLLAFCSKNYILTAYLFYPTDIFGQLLNPDWKLPAEMQHFYYELTMSYAFDLSTVAEIEQFHKWSFFMRIKHWFLSYGLNGVFNQLMVLLLLIFPFWVRKNKAFLWIYIFGLIQFLILFFTSPQYRFFFHIVLIFSLLITAQILIKFPEKLIKTVLIAGLISVLMPLFVSLNVNSLTTNKMLEEQANLFSFSELIEPKPNIRFEADYKLIKEGNLKYYSPESDFFYASGGGPLPSANRQMINYFKRKFDIRPQLRSGDLKDGFYSQRRKK